MDNNVKSSLVEELAKSMGMGSTKSVSTSKFDASTGTLYCDGEVYTRQSIKEARDFCEEMEHKYKKFSGNASELYLIAKLGLDMLLKGSVSSGNNITIKV